MRRSAVIGILAALVIIWLVVVAYLAMAGASSAPTQPAQSKPVRQPVDVGFVPLTGSDPLRVSFQEVNERAALYPLEHLNGSTEKEIYYILGKNVNAQGDAATWIYGIRDVSGAFFLVYNDPGWQEVVSEKDTFPAQKVNASTVFNMSRIFEENGDLFASPSITDREIEVTDNTILVSVREGAVRRSYSFNAVTGALIQTHEE